MVPKRSSWLSQGMRPRLPHLDVPDAFKFAFYEVAIHNRNYINWFA